MMSEDARRRMASGPEARAMGGFRFEQLVRASGRLDVAGEPERRFAGSGLRIQRVGIRNTGEFHGHCWMSALFPSGKGFGCQVFAPKTEGAAAYKEAYLFEGGELISARAVEAPWLTSFEPPVAQWTSCWRPTPAGGSRSRGATTSPPASHQAR